MSELTRDEVIAAVHPIDDATIAEIIATGATEAELAQACRFVAREFREHEHRDVPIGTVGRVISILERVGAKPRGSPLGEAGSTME
ncbi:MAG: hypothetical protein WAL40_19780 [Rhodoplanes sp.]